MTEMIEAEPALARRLLGRLGAGDTATAALAAAVREAAASRRATVVTGCGTSEHGALAVAAILRDATHAAGLPWRTGEPGAPVAAQALELASELTQSDEAPDVVIGVSHEGGTWATNLALERARDHGARVALITVSDRSPAATLATLVVTTEEQDQSWCHTVGYLSPIVAATAVAGALAGRGPDPEAVADRLAAGLAPGAVAAAESLAAGLAASRRILVVGGGADRTAARELTLKLEEGTHLPAAMRDLETLLHGHLAGVDAGDAVVLVLADPAAGAERALRAVGALRAVAAVGARSGAIVAADLSDAIPGALTPLGRLTVPATGDGPARGHLGDAATALLSTAVPLQLLTERVARARGVDPDPIRRDDPAYLAAAEAAG